MFNTNITKKTLDNTTTATTLMISDTYDNQSTTENMKSQPTGTSVSSDATNQPNTVIGATDGTSVDVTSPAETTYHPLTGGGSTMPVGGSARPSDSGNSTVIHSLNVTAMITPLSGNETNVSDLTTIIAAPTAGSDVNATTKTGDATTSSTGTNLNVTYTIISNVTNAGVPKDSITSTVVTQTSTDRAVTNRSDPTAPTSDNVRVSDYSQVSTVTSKAETGSPSIDSIVKSTTVAQQGWTGSDTTTAIGRSSVGDTSATTATTDITDQTASISDTVRTTEYSHVSTVTSGVGSHTIIDSTTSNQQGTYTMTASRGSGVGDTKATTAPSINDGGVSTTGMNVTHVFLNFTVTDMLENITVQMNYTITDKPSDRKTSVPVTESSTQYTSKTKAITANSQAPSTDTGISPGDVNATMPSVTPPIILTGTQPTESPTKYSITEGATAVTTTHTSKTGTHYRVMATDSTTSGETVSVGQAGADNKTRSSISSTLQGTDVSGGQDTVTTTPSINGNNTGINITFPFFSNLTVTDTQGVLSNSTGISQKMTTSATFTRSRSVPEFTGTKDISAGVAESTTPITPPTVDSGAQSTTKSQTTGNYSDGATTDGPGVVENVTLFTTVPTTDTTKYSLLSGSSNGHRGIIQSTMPLMPQSTTDTGMQTTQSSVFDKLSMTTIQTNENYTGYQSTQIDRVSGVTIGPQTTANPLISEVHVTEETPTVAGTDQNQTGSAVTDVTGTKTSSAVTFLAGEVTMTTRAGSSNMLHSVTHRIGQQNGITRILNTEMMTTDGPMGNIQHYYLEVFLISTIMFANN